MTDQQRLVAWGDELIKLHDGFRRDLADLRRSPRGTDLRTHCLAFCDALHLHHAEEDRRLFPHLGGEHPELAEVFACRGGHVAAASRRSRETRSQGRISVRLRRFLRKSAGCPGFSRSGNQ
ncbi:hemerythrin domain-containing protein [Nonomuraea sp. KM88]|uniref:hemerythrin domain-containing protein n=1 Tax=Nonomuraea sp. KM88 TaxID=3457427 RepID=UPI003FCD0FD2